MSISPRFRRRAPITLAASLLIAGMAVPAPGAFAAAPVGSRNSAGLGPLVNIPQTWNNCGPASVAEVLAYWGVMRAQWQVQSVIRADGNPRGTSPYGVPAYMRTLGLRALLGIAGNEGLVKLLVANGFPVIVSQYVSLADHVGHYRPIQAYDNATRTFTSSDPYLGQGHVIGYAEFDAIWKSTNRRFIVLYPTAKTSLLRRVLAAAHWSVQAAYNADLRRTEELLAGKVKDITGYGSGRSYFLNLAWDDLELGRLAAARAALASARRQGASPVVGAWVAAAIARHGAS
jgi:predicted double-glycine peptidase